MAAMLGKIEVPIEAKVMIRVGEHDVSLDELAQALTRAGVELSALVSPLPLAEVEAVEFRSPIDDLDRGHGIFRDINGTLYAVNLAVLSRASNEVPRVEGHITGRI